VAGETDRIRMHCRHARAALEAAIKAMEPLRGEIDAEFTWLADQGQHHREGERWSDQIEAIEKVIVAMKQAIEVLRR
jgi:hypothetical protein